MVKPGFSKRRSFLISAFLQPDVRYRPLMVALFRVQALACTLKRQPEG